MRTLLLLQMSDLLACSTPQDFPLQISVLGKKGKLGVAARFVTLESELAISFSIPVLLDVTVPMAFR